MPAIDSGLVGAGCVVRQVHGIAAVISLRPQAVHGESRVLTALSGVRMTVTEFGAPGQYQHVIVECPGLAASRAVMPVGRETNC